MKVPAIVMGVCISFAGLAASAAAQITITASDVSARLTLGNALPNIADTLLTSADIGAPGATSWDFSGLASHTVSAFTSVQVSTTPWAADFPGATHALKSTLSGAFPGVPGTVDGDLYVFVALGTHLASPGSKGSGTITIPAWGAVLPGQLTVSNVPADITYALPLTLGTSWTSIYTSTQVILISGSPFTTTVTPHDILYTVDAYGQMKMPGGGTFDALRIRKVENAGNRHVGYIFVAANGASVQLIAGDTLQPSSGTIPIQRKSVTWNPPAEPVPIQLRYLEASWDGTEGGTVLRWGTVSEVNNYGFEVQRGVPGNFQSLPESFVPGYGTTVVPRQYSYVDRNPPPGIWYYRLKQTDLDGTVHFTEAVRLEVVTALHNDDGPREFELSQNFPNPFNPTTVVSGQWPVASDVKLVVYDMLGQEVETLASGRFAAGRYEFPFVATGVSSGVYYYRLVAQPVEPGMGVPFAATRRMTLIR